jgi:hypothetical protein
MPDKTTDFWNAPTSQVDNLFAGGTTNYGAYSAQTDSGFVVPSQSIRTTDIPDALPAATSWYYNQVRSTF